MADGITERTKFTTEGEKLEVDVRSGPRRRKSKSGMLMLFERSSGSVLNPSFDSPVLEDYYQKCSFEQSRRRLRFACGYLALCGLVWSIYFGATQRSSQVLLLIVPEVLSVIVFLSLLGISYVNIVFNRVYTWLPLVAVIIKGLLLLASAILFVDSLPYTHLSTITFAGVLQVILITYTLFPVKLFMSLIFGLVLSILFEVSLVVAQGIQVPILVVSKFLLHVCIHLIGVHLLTMSQVRRRSTFLKLCEGACIKRELKNEKTIQSDMITSLMPESVAQKILKSVADTSTSPNPFFVDSMTDVSVLFADIVGFTNMSSNKTAPHLVYLLNDLFGRFDEICEKTGCEKIATLGDCYYCVSGCPTPKPDHAVCCVEMGRAMCVAIQKFDDDHDEKVNMRVGVHTGTVMCGIVGTKRFKFDVYSNDVTLANEMESSGQPGRVHISSGTHHFVKDLYVLEDGEPVPDIRKLKVLVEYYDETTKGYAIKHTQEEAKISTYFVVERIDKKPPLLLDEKKIPKFHDLPQNGVPEMTEEHEGPIDNIMKVERRGSSDSALVADMDAENESMAVFYRPPVSQLTLNFNNSALERSFRQYGLGKYESETHGGLLDNPRISPLTDSVVLMIVLAVVSLSSFLVLTKVCSFVVFALAFVLVAGLLTVLLIDVRQKGGPPAFQAFYHCFFAWYPRNALGSIIVSLPTAVALASFAPCAFLPKQIAESSKTVLFCSLFLLSLCAHCLFTCYSFWTKSLAAVVLSVCGIALVCLSELLCTDLPAGAFNVSGLNATDLDWRAGGRFTQIEFPLACVLVLLLIIFLNREYDVSFRLSFNCDHSTSEERNRIIEEKKRADWLLHNIIPKYIESEMKVKKTYSLNLKNVGVVFASIANFSDFYEEQFAGGTEIMRVLNDYFQDIESLLEQSEYKDVEKIKSVGACLMLASGLNVKTRNANADPEMDHNLALMDFCQDLVEKTEEFNDAMFNFRFELKIGYNIGEVTAGVIGSTKLLYDIWGDTVNVSSRMYSTGVKMRVQVTEQVAKNLEHKYNFEKRGLVTVKGKGELQTCLLVDKK